MFEPDLEARDVLFDLLDEGQMPRQFGQSQIRLDPRRLDGRRAGGDQRGIECVVLGPPQMHAGISLDLNRLQNKNDEARRSQMSDHAALIASRRLDADAPDAGLCKRNGEMPPT